MSESISEHSKSFNTSRFQTTTAVQVQVARQQFTTHDDEIGESSSFPRLGITLIAVSFIELVDANGVWSSRNKAPIETSIQHQIPDDIYPVDKSDA